MKQKTGRKLLSFLLALALVVGLVPGMGLRAYAAGGTEVTKANVICQQYSYMDAGYYGDSGYRTPPVEITNITLADAQAFGAAVTCPTTYWVVVYAKDGDNLKWTSNGKTGEQTSTPDRMSAWSRLYNGDVFSLRVDPMRNVTFYFSKGLATVGVTGVSLDKTTAQTIDVDGKVSFTATVSPDNATDKTVKWSVGGTDAGAVKLYSNEACTTEVGADATDKLTVYAKGISAGSATVTATSNADSTKSASCDVTVNAAQTQTETLLTTITATGKEQASYSTENVATVSFSYTANGYSSYTNNGKVNWGWWGYGWSATVNAAEGYTITKCVFYDDKDRTATDSEAPFVVETTEEDKTPKVNGTPILANTSRGITKIEVYGYATPTATHSVTITAGDHMTKTAGSGDAEQTGLTGAMTDVVYTADNGYYYPTNYSVAEVSGIKVTRDSYTQITVSGTPTADAAITLTAPTAKTTPAAPTTATATDCTTSDNNDGKLTGVTTAMEYKKSDAEDWTAGTGSDITGLVPGTYYVRVKATDTTLASDNQELTVKGFISYTVTFKVVNGSWDDETTADKTVTLTGHDGDTLKLAATDIPAVGTKPNDTYKAGSWDVTPSADTAITAATTYTYTYAQKDSISQTVTFKVVNGSWNDETTTDKTVTLTGYEGDTLKLSAAQIPAVGTKPSDTYKAGSWDTTPSTDTAITADTTYTYTYAQKDSISQTVTFKVVNGSWNDETTTDKTVTLTGYEGDTLKLSAAQIPAVGTKPSDTYKAGSWDVTPSTETAITEATTYTYTYAQKDSISQTVTFKVVNGSWDDETTADKTVTLTGHDGDTLKLAATDIPAVGTKPNDTYKAGSWDVTPSADTAITAATTYTYTYAQKDSISQTVTFKVVNGSWNDETTTDKTVTLTGYEGDTLKLAANQIPAVGTKPNDTYKAGSWDTTPSTETAITEATTYTYTYAAKEASVVTKAPEAKTLTYNGSAQELVTAGEATGGEMQYALGDANGATQPYTTSIPTATNTGTYYVWYKAVGDNAHSDSEARYVTVKIEEKTEAHTHKIVRVEAKEPTCTEDGYKEHYACTECGAWFGDSTGVYEITDKSGYTIEAIGHKWGAYEVTKRPTYDEEGLKVCTCENDPSHTKEETIPRLSSSSSSDSDSDSDSDSGSSGGSGSKNNSVSKQVIDVNGNVKSNVPSNHQVETGVPASDVGGRWGNNANADTWTYTKSDGSLAKSEWLSLDYNGLRYWYYFNDDGNMHTNWFDYKGERFYLMPDKDGWRGRMATGWKNIENKWYYFETVPGSSQGRLYRSTVTPDGHTVGADGAWNGVGATPVGQK